MSAPPFPFASHRSQAEIIEIERLIKQSAAGLLLPREVVRLRELLAARPAEVEP